MSVICDSSMIAKGKIRYVVACFVLAGLFHVWAPFLGKGLPVCVAFFSQLQCSVCAREVRVISCLETRQQAAISQFGVIQT